MPDEGKSIERISARKSFLSPRRARAAASAPLAKTTGYQNPLRTADETRSLFSEILDWMLAPLLLLWPISITLTYIGAESIANVPFDRSLGDAVAVLAHHVRESDGEVSLDVSAPAGELLHDDGTGSIHYMVLGARKEFVAGDRDLPIPPEDEIPRPHQIQYRFDKLRGNELRIAHTWVELRRDGAPAYALVQVAETLDKRTQLANEIITGVMVPQFVMLPIAVLLVWFGLSRGLAPLSALQAQIHARKPDDLSPINPRAAPEEIAPVVASFNELLERLALNVQLQQRFLADAAHQMKTPLAGLRTQAELALRETDPRELKRSLRQIAGATERATHLINQLLSLARAENLATDPGGMQVIELGTLARELVQTFVPDAIARGLDLGFEDSKRPVRIFAAAVLIRELLKNLVDNAMRYTPAGGSITVRIRQRRNAAYLEVEDTGPGIPVNERKHVFDRFYRILGTNVDGSGLGLAIVREIAEQHGALLRISFNPHSNDEALPGTLISVEFEAIVADDPTVVLDDSDDAAV
ncbi:MAG: sensor histidine kinase N-terminal domain-containing protein [Burkholderiaceae bacterium]